MRWFADRVAAGPLPGYRYVGDLERNILLPTAVGALRPSALVPETMAAGDGASAERVCVVGTRSLRDFHAALCASNLRRAGIDARSVEVEIEVDRADQNTLGLARKFDDPAWRAAFGARLALKLQTHERVGLPAMLGLRDPHGAWSDLEHRLGRPRVRDPDAAAVGPGDASLRDPAIDAAWRRRAAGARRGGRVVRARRLAGDVGGDAVGRSRLPLRGAVVRARVGRIRSGAIELDSRWATHERVLGLALRGLPAADEPRFVGDYLAEQPMARVGVAVDSRLGPRARRMFVVAGAALPGAVPWREGSGEGIALASGSHAAQLVLARSGAPAGAAA